MIFYTEVYCARHRIPNVDLYSQHMNKTVRNQKLDILLKKVNHPCATDMMLIENSRNSFLPQTT